MFVPIPRQMIKVKTLTGKEIEIDIEPTDSIERIKERVEEKEGIPPVQQRCVPQSSSGAEPTHFFMCYDCFKPTRRHTSTSTAGARGCFALRSTELRRPIPRTPPATFGCHLARHGHKPSLHPLLQTCAPVVQTHQHPTRAPQPACRGAFPP